MDYTIKAGTRDGAHEVYFDGKPDEATRNALKALKMRWNGKKLCWYGFISEEAIKNAINGVPQTDNALNDCYTIDTTATDGYLGASAFRGSNYVANGHLYGAELTAALRKMLKQCGIKGVTVKSKTFSGGQEVGVTVKVMDGDIVTKDDYINSYDVYGRAWIRMANGKDIYESDYFALPEDEQKRIKYEAATADYDYFIQDLSEYGYQINHYHIEKDKHFTSQFVKRFEAIYRVINSFNADSSNSMVDYFDRSFYDFYKIKA